MKPEILYTPSAYLYPKDMFGGKTPVVRYADHCARVSELELDRDNARRRCDNLLKQLERMAILLEEKHVPLGRW